MLRNVKEYIKTKPIVYDLLNSIRPINGPGPKWLDSFSKSNGTGLRFVQVGASDGLRWDPIRRFVIRDRWRGVFIEPLSPVFNMLKDNYSYLKNRSLFFENCAISDANENSITFWSFSNSFLNQLSTEKQLYFLRKSSLDRRQVEAFIKDDRERCTAIQSYKVPCKTLAVVINTYFTNDPPDLVFIDAEGRDDEVIKTIDFDSCLPKAIFYESHNLGSREEDTKTYLASKGYKTFLLGGDTVAVLR